MNTKIVLEGFDRLARELKLANPHIRARVVAAIRTNTQAITVQAVARAPRKTGELAATGRAEYGRDGLTGLVKFGYGELGRRSRATTAKGARRFAKVQASRDARAVKFSKAGSSRATLASADLGVYAPVIDRGDSRRHIKAQHYLGGPFETQKPIVIRDIGQAMTATVDEMGGGP